MDIFRPKKNIPDEPNQDQAGNVHEEKKISVKNEKGVVPVSNFTEEDDEKQENSMKKKKVLMISGAGLLALVLLFGSGFAYSYFEKYAKKTQLETLLPGGSNLVIKANIDPQSEQYKLLDEHLAKFPGHERIMKELDEVGEGVTISEFINKKLNERGLDFDQDIKDAIGENAYLLITSLKPIEDLFQQKVSFWGNKSEDALKDYLALSEDSAQMKVAGGTGDGARVLGLTSDYFLMAENEQRAFSEPLDYIVGAEVENLKKAREAINKMMSNKERYQVYKISYGGYYYFKVIDKKFSSDGSTPFDLGTSYHAVLGSNWLMASNEQDLKDSINRHKTSTILGNATSFLSKNNSQNVAGNNLKADQNFNDLVGNVDAGAPGDNSLATIFYRFDPSEIFGGSNEANPYYGFQKMFKYPEEIAGSFSVVVQQDGLKLRMSSNQHSLEEKNNVPFMDGLVKKIPNNLDGHWADIYFEYDNPKSVYYSFKRNNLSEEGLAKWNEFLGQIKQAIGVDLEADFVDQVTGDVALVGYTGKGLEPEGVAVVGIDNQDKVLSTISKVLELGKQMYVSASPYASCFMEAPVVDDQQDTYINSLCAMVDQNPAQKKVLEQQFEAVLASTIRETETEQGKIYSYNLPGTELSFDFSFKDGQLLFGTHYAIVDAMMKEYGADPGNEITSNKYYKQIAGNVFPEGYSKVCINSFGLWNSVEYYMKEFSQSQSGAAVDGSAGYSQGHDNNLYAIGSIIKTVRLFGGSDAVSQNGNVMSSLYMNIEELPQEQKGKAEEIMKTW